MDKRRVLVTVSGPTGSGKDTFIRSFIDHMGRNKVLELSSIDPVADALSKHIFPAMGHVFNRRELRDEDRRVLSKIKEVLDEEYGYTIGVVASALAQFQDVTLVQVREPHVVTELHSLIGQGVKVYSVYVTRNVTKEELAKRRLPFSDKDYLTHCKWDYIVTNNFDVDDLDHMAETFAGVVTTYLAGAGK